MKSVILPTQFEVFSLPFEEEGDNSLLTFPTQLRSRKAQAHYVLNLGTSTGLRIEVDLEGQCRRDGFQATERNR